MDEEFQELVLKRLEALEVSVVQLEKVIKRLETNLNEALCFDNLVTHGKKKEQVNQIQGTLTKLEPQQINSKKSKFMTETFRVYEFKEFEPGQIRNVVIKLANLHEVYVESAIVIARYKPEGDTETRRTLTLDECTSLCKIGLDVDGITIGFGNNLVSLSNFDGYLKAFFVISAAEQDFAKKVVFLVQNCLGLVEVTQKQMYNQLEPQDSVQKVESKSLPDLPDNPIINAWKEATGQFRLIISPARYETWFAPIVPGVEGQSLVLNCFNEFAKDWLESRYIELIRETVLSIKPSISEIIFRAASHQTNRCKS